MFKRKLLLFTLIIKRLENNKYFTHLRLPDEMNFLSNYYRLFIFYDLQQKPPAYITYNTH